MSVKLMAQVFEMSFDWGVNPKQPTIKLVLLALADHASDSGEAIYPSIAHVCAKTGLSRRAVINVIAAAKERGILTVVGKRRQVLEYKLDLSANRSADQCTRCTGAPGAPVPVHRVHYTGAPGAHVTINKPPSEPSIAPTSETARKPHLQREMVGALMAVTGGVSGAQLARPAAALVAAGYTAAEIMAAYQPGGWWYRHDWRGQRGQAPTAAQIVQTAGQTRSGMPAVVRTKATAAWNELTSDMTEDEARSKIMQMTARSQLQL